MSSWIPPGKTARKYNRKGLQILRSWSGPHSHQGTTHRPQRGCLWVTLESITQETELAMGLHPAQRAPRLIASTQLGDTFPAPHFFSLYPSLHLPSSYFQPHGSQRQPREWLRSRRARWGKTRNEADLPQPPGLRQARTGGKWRAFPLNEAMFWQLCVNLSFYWLKGKHLCDWKHQDFLLPESAQEGWGTSLDFHPGTEKE